MKQEFSFTVKTVLLCEKKWNKDKAVYLEHFFKLTHAKWPVNWRLVLGQTINTRGDALKAKILSERLLEH